MIMDCSNNEQKAFVVSKTFDPITSELANLIKLKDADGMSSVVEAMSGMMPYMTQDMLMKMPSMMMAALSLVKS